MRITSLIMTGASTVIAVLAAAWARLAVKNAKAERDRIQEVHDVIAQAGKRLEAARQANHKPIDPKKRNDFEEQP